MYLAYNCKIIIADIYNYIPEELSVIIFSIVQDYSFIPVEIQLLSLRASHKNSCKGRIKKDSRTFDFPVRYFKRRSLNVNRFFSTPIYHLASISSPSRSLWRGSRFSIKQTSRTNKVRTNILSSSNTLTIFTLSPYSSSIQTIFNLPRTELKAFTIQFPGGSLHFQGPSRPLIVVSRKTRWSPARYEVSPIILTAATGTEVMKGPGRVGLVAVARAVLRSCRG